jgi:hypothetical protein
MNDWELLGSHRYRVVDTVLCFEPHGELALGQAQLWSAILGAHFQQHPAGFLIVDAHDLKPPTAAVRRLFVAFLRECRPPPRVVAFGANLLIRTVSRLVLSAARQLSGLELDLTQFASEPEAWAHVALRRELSRSA